jgi:hypothetical protein
MAASTSKPLMDPELRASLDKISFPTLTILNAEVIKTMRAVTATPSSFLDDQKARGISHREIRISSQDGSNHEIVLSILQQAVESTAPRPCLYW